MAKHLCKLSESVKKNFETIASLVDRPRFVCTDCGRAANDKKRLCEPKRIPAARRGRVKKDKPESGSASDG
jgi:transposase-like protein